MGGLGPFGFFSAEHCLGCLIYLRLKLKVRDKQAKRKERRKRRGFSFRRTDHCCGGGRSPCGRSHVRASSTTAGGAPAGQLRSWACLPQKIRPLRPVESDGLSMIFLGVDACALCACDIQQPGEQSVQVEPYSSHAPPPAQRAHQADTTTHC